MKKSLASPLLLCAILPAFAQQKTPISEKPDDRVNFPSNYQVERGADLFLYGDYLYWSASEDGLYFAQKDSSVKKIEPSWDSGLRLGAGVTFPKEGMDLVFYWTWFKTGADKQVSSDSDTLIPLWATPDFTDAETLLSAKAKWDLDVNLFDLEWGCASWYGGSFSVRPFFGLRGLWLDQDFSIDYLYNTSPTVTETLHIDSDFHGGGLRAGADVRFAMGYGFSLYGIASGSLLYGHFNANLKGKEDTTVIAKTEDEFSKGISSLQLVLGLSWDSHFKKERYHLEFHAGWEQNMWFSVNQMNHFLNTFDSGFYFKEKSNLSLQGLTLGGRFSF